MTHPASPGHADDLFGQYDYEPVVPARRDFLAWHKPRKQLVRTHWKELIDSLLAGLEPGGTLRYLGLPGSDLLDIRYFHDSVCVAHDRRLHFLGFNSGAQPRSAEQTSLNISLDEVRKLSHVEARSDVIGDDFVRIANRSSVAWKRVRDAGPFHVVNLDLCDGFGQQASDTVGGTHYDAFSRLVSLQARTKEPWLFLLTTRVGDGYVDPDVLERLVQGYLVNLDECEGFRERSDTAFGVHDETSLRDVLSQAEGHACIFLSAVCKWLARFAHQQIPPTAVELKSVIGYRVSEVAASQDLYSIALLFTPTLEGAGDAVGLVAGDETRIDECRSAKRILDRVGRRVDADAILAGDMTLLDSLVDESADLLAAARYDPDAYRAWVTQP